MEERDHLVEQSVEAVAQEEAPVLQNVCGSTTPAPLMPQFYAQFAQQMAALFQQMAENMPTQAPIQTLMVQTQPPAKQYDKLMKFGAIEFKDTMHPLEAEQ